MKKIFYQTKNHYFLILNGETQNFPKNKDFLPNAILKLLSNLQEISTSPVFLFEFSHSHLKISQEFANF